MQVRILILTLCYMNGDSSDEKLPLKRKKKPGVLWVDLVMESWRLHRFL